MYKLEYGFDRKVSAIRRLTDGAFIPLCEGNSDYQEFLKWNSEQKTPLDLNSTIEVVKPIPPRDLGKEIDELKDRLTTSESLEAEIALLKSNQVKIATATKVTIDVMPIK